MPILTWIKLGGAVAVCALMWYLGYSFEASRFDRYKAEQVIQTAKIVAEQQAQADQIRKTKDDQIRNIDAKLADALVQLRSRPSRTEQASNGQAAGFCDGSKLYAEDAELALREASRADKIRVALLSCYTQYDSLK